MHQQHGRLSVSQLASELGEEKIEVFTRGQQIGLLKTTRATRVGPRTPPALRGKRDGEGWSNAGEIMVDFQMSGVHFVCRVFWVGKAVGGLEHVSLRLPGNEAYHSISHVYNMYFICLVSDS